MNRSAGQHDGARSLDEKRQGTWPRGSGSMSASRRLILFLERKSIKKNFVYALNVQRTQGFAPGNERKAFYW